MYFFILRLDERGALAAGLLADMAYYEDLTSWKPSLVWKNGRLVWPSSPVSPAAAPAAVQLERNFLNTVKIRTFHPEALKVPASGSKIRVIGVKPGQAMTDSLDLSWPAEKGFYEASPRGRDR